MRPSPHGELLLDSAQEAGLRLEVRRKAVQLAGELWEDRQDEPGAEPVRKERELRAAGRWRQERLMSFFSREPVVAMAV